MRTETETIQTEANQPIFTPLYNESTIENPKVRFRFAPYKTNRPGFHVFLYRYGKVIGGACSAHSFFMAAVIARDLYFNRISSFIKEYESAKESAKTDNLDLFI